MTLITLDFVDLLEMLEKWVPLDSGFDYSHSIGRMAIAGRETESCISTVDIFDMDEFVRRNLGDLDLCCEVASIFIDCAPEYIKSIRKAAIAQDCEKLRQSAHKLRGAAANLSLSLVSETSSLIESAAESGDLEKAGSLLSELDRRFEQVVGVIRELLITPNKNNVQ